MKRLLSLIVVLVIALGTLTACDLPFDLPFDIPFLDKFGGETDIQEAVDQLNDIYAEAATATPNDYELIAQITLEKTEFTVTWTADTDKVKLELVDGFWVVDVPDDNAEAINYKLTGTITSPKGQSATVEYSRIVPAGGIGMITNPVAGTAYKLALLHGNENAVVYFDGNNYNNYAWYLSYTIDPLAAVDVYLETVEGVEGGYRLYFNKDGEKTYIVAFPRDGDTTKGTLKLDTEVPTEYYTYSTEYNTLLYTSVTGEQFYIGSSGTYKSISCSALSYIDSATSYPVRLYGAGGVKEELPEQELPEVPENYTSKDIVDALYKLESGQTLDGPYEITGVVTSIKYEYDPAYNNVSVVIVVDNMTDKPVLCYRITGEGADTVKVGDTLTVFAGITNYGGTYETVSGGVIREIVEGDPSDTPVNPKPDQPAGDAVLDLTTDAHLVTGSGEQNVFAANGITFTNDKASSSSPLVVQEQYSQRAYKGSTIKIEYTGMTKIVITLDDHESNGKTYMAGFDGMIVEGATITRDGGDIVTIYFAAPTNVFQSTELTSQTRIEKIEVYTGEVETPDQGGTDTPVTPSYTAPVAGQAYKFFLEQKTFNKTLYFAGTMDGDYLATTEDINAAVDIYFETVDGGYHIYFYAGDVKTYITAAAYLKSNGYAGCHFALTTDTPTLAWTYNTTYGIVEIYDEIEGKSDTFFAGTYGEYKTISLSGAYYKDQISSGSQFPARIVISEGPAHEHNYESVVTAPTCTADGYTTYTCECGDTYTEAGATAPGHSYSAVVTAPTCTADGYTTYTCACGDTYTEAGATAPGHNYVDGTCSVCGTPDPNHESHTHDYTAVVTAPTCTAEGYTTYTCACEDSYVADKVAALGHSYSAVVTAPTCTAEGYTTHTCSRCQDTYTDSTVAALGHSYSAVVTAPTCTAEGYTTHTCSRCQDTYTDSTVAATGHNYVDGTCSACGEKEVVDDGVMSIPEVLASAEGTEVVVKGTVKEFYYTWNTQYNNCSVYIVDEAGNKLLCFRLKTNVTIGDQITVTGTATVYNGTIQVAEGCTAVIDVPHVCSTFTEGSCIADSFCTVCGELHTAAPGHNYVNGTCSNCGGAEPQGDFLPGNLSFGSAANKANADTYMKENFPEWKVTNTLGQTYGGYLGFGRSGDNTSAITSSAFSVSKAFTVTAVIKGNGSSGVMTSTLTFTLVDASGNVIATGYANDSTTAAITPVDAKDTTYNISFTFVEGKTWTDVSNLVVTFAKATGNIGLKSLNFVQ